MSTKWFGKSVQRRGDDRLLKGEGRYLDDISLPGMVHVAFLRSVHSSAFIRKTDLSAAKSLAGVIDVVTHQDLGTAGAAFPQLLPHQGLMSATWSALAAGEVRFVGEPVAAVVAESPDIAADAVELIDVEYEPKQPVQDLETAILPGSPAVHRGVPSNIAMHSVDGSTNVEDALRRAPRRLKERFRPMRGGGMPLEPRGVLASLDLDRRELTVWSSTQEPHSLRNVIAQMLNLPRQFVRVIVPDTGGGFGAKLNVYPEEVLVPWLAVRLKRPIKWKETRSEHMVSATQERLQIHDVEVGFDQDGRILALRDRFYHDMGAYAPRGGAVPHTTSGSLVGPYRIPFVQVELIAVYTNTAAVSAYRGAGQPQGVFVVERIIDRVAEACGMDPAQARRANMIPLHALPYDTGLKNLLGGKVEYDGGDFIAGMDHALELAGYEALRETQRHARRASRYFGVGIANYVELTGRGPWEGAGVRVEPDGRVTVVVGTCSQGQGHETALAQICADALGASLESITIASGDTALIPHGIGTFASRVAVLAGNSVSESAKIVRKRILELAGEMLEAATADLDVEDGKVFVVGSPQRHVSFEQVAKFAVRAASNAEDIPGLEATHYFKAPKVTYSNGTHVCAVEVFPDTGEVIIQTYAISHDCGRVINPRIVEGQIWGGLACGLGNAMMEQHIYNDAGQLLTGSFMDYTMPRASDVGEVRIGHLETPSTSNPLGIKGAGEGGTIPVPAAVANAVEDALRPIGVRITEHPLTPFRVWKLIRTAKEEQDGRPRT